MFASLIVIYLLAAILIIRNNAFNVIIIGTMTVIKNVSILVARIKGMCKEI